VYGENVFRRGLLLLLAMAVIPHAALAASAQLDGVVVDAQSGLPVSGAQIRLIDKTATVRSDTQGRFAFTDVAPGLYRVQVAHDGYQTTDSDDIALADSASTHVILSIIATTSGQGAIVIGRTATRPGESLQQSTTMSRTISADTLAAAGMYRGGDALRQLPGVNNGITGDTASLGDDINLSIRGIGTLETVATLDGHPIASGAPGGYNFQLSPIVGLRDMRVFYGSGGADFLGVNAIGGVIDFRTIEPTRESRTSITQGFGTFDKLATTLQTTGTFGRLGYAAAAGVSTLDGPIRHDSFYQPGAAFDQSATSAAVRNLGVYPDDSTATTRSAVAKLRYAMSDATSLTFTSVASSYWEDKTGNGDGDYLPLQTALAQGNALLANKSGKDACGPGTFTATNANGVANGAGPGGIPDGGIRCQTPSQWAAFNTGFAGAGPAWQSFNFDDEHVHLNSGTGNRIFSFDAFTNRYLNTGDRRFALPFTTQPGDSPAASVTNRNISTTGATATESFLSDHDDIDLGYGYLNVADALLRNGGLTGAPIVHETSIFMRESHHFGRGLTAYSDAYFKHSTATNTSYADPRLALVWSPHANDVFRVAAGATTAQPTGDELLQPFVPALPGGVGGGSAISCTSLNSIGSAPSSVLQPERGVDEELVYGHRFGGDSHVQISLYDVNVYNKIFKTLDPITSVGTGFIDPTFLAQAIAKVSSVCGAQSVNSLLGVSGNVNVGQLRSRGYTIDGRARISRSSFIDYDYTLDSTVLVSAPINLLESTKTLILGSQLPRLPLQTFNISLDTMITNVAEARYTLHTVSSNNTKSLPAYNYSELQFTRPIGRGIASISVSNLFNQYGDIRGLRGLGVPLALNGFATAADYTPLIGTAATEQFGLPNRALFTNYSLRTR
jgi:hypothetical protein